MPDNLDMDLIKEMFETYRGMMFKIAMGILHNESDSEDVVQDAFLWIINNLDKISQIPCNKRASYFAIITEHISLNMIKKKRTHPFDDIDEHLEFRSDVSVEKAALDNISVQEIKLMIGEMSKRDQYILQLYYFEEKSIEEISEIMGFSERNARVYLHRAQKRLREKFKERGFDYDV